MFFLFIDFINFHEDTNSISLNPLTAGSRLPLQEELLNYPNAIKEFLLGEGGQED